MKTKNIVLGGILAVIGLLMIINPGACINAVVVLVGLTAVVIGGYNLFYTYKNCTVSQAKKMILIKSIVSIVIGLIAVISPFALVKTVASIWKIISIVLGVYLILFAAAGIYSGIKYKSENPEDFKKNLTEGIICVLIAILLFIIPVGAVGLTIVKALGVIGIIVGAVLILVEVGIARRTTVATKDDVTIVDDEEAADSTPEAETAAEPETEKKDDAAEGSESSEDSK